MWLRRGLSVCKEPGHVFRGDAVDRAVNAACATFSGSSGSGGRGLPQMTLQNRQLRVQTSPRSINVAVCF